MIQRGLIPQQMQQQFLEISPEAPSSADPAETATGSPYTGEDSEETTSLLEDRESFGHEGLLEDRPEDVDDDERIDHVQCCMRQVGKTPLLTTEEEKEASMRIEEARRELENIGLSLPFVVQGRGLVEPLRAGSNGCAQNMEQDLPAAELKQLHGRIKMATQRYVEARNVLAKANLRLVVAIARKYTNRGLSFPDLVQEGSVGLMKAVEKFDCRMGYRFGTYALWWIRQSITRAIVEQTRTIHIPAHMIETVKNVARISRALAQGLGREPCSHEIAEEMGLPVQTIREALHSTYQTISLETSVVDGETRLVDLLEDKNASAPQDPVLFHDLVEGLNKALSTLTAREEKLIRMRFGVGETSHHTLEELAQTFGLTQERVRQLEAKALRKLRRHVRVWEA